MNFSRVFSFDLDMIAVIAKSKSGLSPRFRARQYNQQGFIVNVKQKVGAGNLVEVVQSFIIISRQCSLL
jgi:hypothetical protein